jgi:hypothetical protein
MTKNQQIKRMNEVLYFIWRVKAVLIRHIEKMYFKTNVHTRRYLLALEKKGYLGHMQRLMPEINAHPGAHPEKVYFLTYSGIQYLKKAGYEVVRYIIHQQAMQHDLMVTDILIYFIKNFDGFKSYRTDYELRRENHKKKKKFKTPDFTFEDKDGRKYLVEYQLTRKTKAIIKDYLSDYHAFDELKKHDIIYIVPKPRMVWYSEIFKDSSLKHWHVMSYDPQKGLETAAEG